MTKPADVAQAVYRESDIPSGTVSDEPVNANLFRVLLLVVRTFEHPEHAAKQQRREDKRKLPVELISL